MYVVDLNKEILSKAEERIKTSLQRVAKKTFAEDPKVSCKHTECTDFSRLCATVEQCIELF